METGYSLLGGYSCVKMCQKGVISRMSNVPPGMTCISVYEYL